MAKQAGMGDALYVDGVDISGDVGSVQRMGNPSNALDVTGLDKSGMERIYGIYDGEISFTAFFNDALSFPALKAKGSGADRYASYFKGGAIGNMAANVVAKQINFDPNRPQDGSLTIGVQCLGTGHALEYGEQLTAGKRTDTSATNGSSLDGGGATSLGLAAYLHVFDFTGTSVTVTLEESSDNGAGDAFAAVTGGAFAAATGVGSQRIVTALDQAVERYLRAVSSGTFSNAVFAVSVTRFPVA